MQTEYLFLQIGTITGWHWSLEIRYLIRLIPIFLTLMLTLRHPFSSSAFGFFSKLISLMISIFDRGLAFACIVSHLGIGRRPTIKLDQLKWFVQKFLTVNEQAANFLYHVDYTGIRWPILPISWQTLRRFRSFFQFTIQHRPRSLFKLLVSWLFRDLCFLLYVVSGGTKLRAFNKQLNKKYYLMTVVFHIKHLDGSLSSR